MKLKICLLNIIVFCFGILILIEASKEIQLLINAKNENFNGPKLLLLGIVFLIPVFNLGSIIKQLYLKSIYNQNSRCQLIFKEAIKHADILYSIFLLLFGGVLFFSLTYYLFKGPSFNIPISWKTLSSLYLLIIAALYLAFLINRQHQGLERKK